MNPSKSSEDLYNIVYKNEEIGVVASKCKQEFYCTCRLTSDPDCGKVKEEIKETVTTYYENRAKALREMSIEDFMMTYGFYYDK